MVRWSAVCRTDGRAVGILLGGPARSGVPMTNLSRHVVEYCLGNIPVNGQDVHPIVRIDDDQ